VVKMKDIVSIELLKAKNKGRDLRLNVLVRYFRIKYRLIITSALLLKRLKRMNKIKSETC